MKTKIAAALLISLAMSGAAFAQKSKSEVKIDNVIATNAAVMGSTAKQNVKLANAANGGEATLTTKNVIVTNAAVMGSKAKQDVNVGNAE